MSEGGCKIVAEEPYQPAFLPLFSLGDVPQLVHTPDKLVQEKGLLSFRATQWPAQS